MSRARDFADLAGSADAGGLTGRNLIINGAMQVFQRGTSFTSNGFGPDRFAVYPTTNGTTFQRSTDAPDGFAYSLTTSGTPTGSYLILTPVELPATGDAGLLYNGQKITISYYAKSSSAGDELYNKLTFRDTSTSATNEVSVDNDSSDKHTLTTSWARYSKTYTIGANPAGTNKSFVVNPRSVSTPSGNISITGVQLEVGDKATPFEHRSYADELQRCQRYYYETGTEFAYTYHGNGVADGTGAYILFFPPQTFRAGPTLTATNPGNLMLGDGAGVHSVSAVSIDVGLPEKVALRATASGLTAGEAVRLLNNNSTLPRLQYSAEL